MKKVLLLIIILAYFIYPQDIQPPLQLTKYAEFRITVDSLWAAMGGTASPFKYSTPEEQLYLGNASTITQAIKMAVDSAAGRIVLLTQSYTITDSIVINFNVADETEIIIEGTENSKMTADFTKAGNYWKFSAPLTFRNAKSITMRGVKLESYNTGSTNYYSGILIEDCDDVKLSNVESRYAGYMGIVIKNADNLEMTNCRADSNLYAGATIVNSKHSTVVGGTYSYNGHTAPTDGYGLNFAHQYGTGSNNEAITIKGIQANYNLRKGIDIHGGINVVIDGNFVKGFTYAGIGAAHEGGDLNHLKTIRSVIIKQNIIEQDSVWFANLTAINPYSHPIQFGAYNLRDSTIYWDGTSGEDSIVGSWICSENILKNCNAWKGGTNYLLYMINAFSGKAKSIQLNSNSFENSAPVNAIYVGTGNDYGGQPKDVKIFGNIFTDIISSKEIVGVYAGRNVEIMSNSFDSCYAETVGDGYGIKIVNYGNGSDIKVANIHDNSFVDGNFYNAFIDINQNINYVTRDNIVWDLLTQRQNTGIHQASHSITLPNMNTKGSGSVSYVIETSETYPDTVKTLYVDATANTDGSARFEIKITLQYAIKDSGATYEWDASAKNYNDASYNFDVTMLNAKSSDFDPENVNMMPTVFWETVDTSKKILCVRCPQPYTSYKIDINFNCWRLTPVQRKES